ncbi:MAG: hypothetical protein IK114_03515 [Fibrobacter sp.]|nr:hypothetical protein [Fibrobacter sp.]
MKTTKKMAYKKPRLIAKNNPSGSFAAGCPSQYNNHIEWCIRCDYQGP